jgi:hypothetical protein
MSEMKKASLFAMIAAAIIALSLIASYSPRDESNEIPAWILAERVVFPPSETAVELHEHNFSHIPLLAEALEKADDAQSRGLAHTMELVNCTNSEARELIGFLGGEYSPLRTDYPFKIRLILPVIGDNYKLYQILITFSWKRPMLA